MHSRGTNVAVYSKSCCEECSCKNWKTYFVVDLLCKNA